MVRLRNSKGGTLFSALVGMMLILGVIVGAIVGYSEFQKVIAMNAKYDVKAREITAFVKDMKVLTHSCEDIKPDYDAMCDSSEKYSTSLEFYIVKDENSMADYIIDFSAKTGEITRFMAGYPAITILEGVKDCIFTRENNLITVDVLLLTGERVYFTLTMLNAK